MEVILIMKCTFCGAELNDDVMFCTECGRAVEAAPAEPAEAFVKAEKNPGKILGLVAMLLAIASIVLPVLSIGCSCIPYVGALAMGIIDFLCLIIAIVGLILAIVAKKKSKAAGHKNAMATVALILSIIHLAFVVIGIVIGVLLVVLVFLGACGLGSLESLMYY